MQSSHLNCTYEGHKEKPILAICLDKECDKLRPVCFLCTKQFHSSHLSELMDLSEFEEFRRKSINEINNLQAIIGELESAAIVVKKFLGQLALHSTQVIHEMTTTQINNDVGQLNVLKQFLASMQTPLQESLSKLQIVKQYCESKALNQILQPEFQKLVVKQDYKVQQQQLVEPECSQIQQLITEVDKQMKSIQYRFSTTDKYKMINVSPEGTVAEGMLGFCICDQAIPQNGVTKFGFRAKQCDEGYVYIGVCNRDLVRKAAFTPNIWDKIGHGSYLIKNGGYSHSHHQKDMNNAFKSFKFSDGDIIIIEVDISGKKITFIKKKPKKSFIMQLNIQGDLYPAIGYDFPGGSIEIINDL